MRDAFIAPGYPAHLGESQAPRILPIPVADRGLEYAGRSSHDQRRPLAELSQHRLERDKLALRVRVRVRRVDADRLDRRRQVDQVRVYPVLHRCVHEIVTSSRG